MSFFLLFFFSRSHEERLLAAAGGQSRCSLVWSGMVWSQLVHSFPQSADRDGLRSCELCTGYWVCNPLRCGAPCHSSSLDNEPAKPAPQASVGSAASRFFCASSLLAGLAGWLAGWLAALTLTEQFDITGLDFGFRQKTTDLRAPATGTGHATPAVSVRAVRVLDPLVRFCQVCSSDCLRNRTLPQP
jgi:hypothetical protein